MPTITLPGGAVATVTLEELRSLMQGGSGTAPEPAVAVSVDAAWDDFLGRISGPAPGKVRQRKLLALAKGRASGLTINELCEKIGDKDNNITSGTTAAIGKHVRNSGMEERDVFYKDPDDGKYKPGPLLLEREIPVP